MSHPKDSVGASHEAESVEHGGRIVGRFALKQQIVFRSVMWLQLH